MAQLDVQEIDHPGLEPDAGLAGADAAGDTFQNTGNEFLRVQNGAGADRVVTVDSVQECSFGFDHDVQVTVPAGEERWIGAFSVERFGETPSITYDDAAGLQVGVYNLD